jgi:hypothetical protein
MSALGQKQTCAAQLGMSLWAKSGHSPARKTWYFARQPLQTNGVSPIDYDLRRQLVQLDQLKSARPDRKATGLPWVK